MKVIDKFIWVSCLLILIGSCKKDEDLNLTPPVGLGGETYAKGPVDQWLLDSLTKPYNIAVKYRWDPFEYQLDKTLTPPDESKVVPAMSAVKRVWIDPYNAETGSELFIKKYSPKQFVLVGSVQYNVNGTVLLGQAEGGNNIVFLDINQNFDQNDISSLRRMIETSHHEFAHILHQNVMYPQDYKFINSNLGLPGYTATWFNVSDAEALTRGYVTSYAMASSDEDFVEMVANMLMEGRARFNEIVASTNPTAQQSLRAKEQIVVTYFREVYDIDFYSLQARVQAALYSLIPVPSVEEAFGFNKTYNSAIVNPANQGLLPQPAAFTTIFNNAKTGLAAIDPGGREFLGFALTYDSETTIILTIFYRNLAGDQVQGNYLYEVTKDATDLYTFSFKGGDATGNFIYPGVAPLVDYFSNNKFTVTWYADPGVSIYPRVKFTPQGMPGTYFIASL